MGAGAAGDALHALVGAAAFVRANPRSDRFKVWQGWGRRASLALALCLSLSDRAMTGAGGGRGAPANTSVRAPPIDTCVPPFPPLSL